MAKNKGKKSTPTFKQLSKPQKAAVSYTTFALAQAAVAAIWAGYRAVKERAK